jgi:uncharacterized caspase-like protein
MKRGLPLLLTVIILSASTIPAQVKSASTTQRYGIIIGISDYESIMDLELTDDDAAAMDAVLGDLYWPHVTLLLNQQASRTGIRDAIQALQGTVDGDDIVRLYFAGHGTYGDDLSPLDEVDGFDEYICPWDATPDPATSIRDDELEAWLDALPCRKVVILDTCFSGGFIRENEMTPRTMPGRPKAELEGSVDRDLAKPGYIILASCEHYEHSYESTTLGHGVFTYFLLQGMAPAPFPADAAPLTTAYAPLQHPRMHDDDSAAEVEIGCDQTVGGEVTPVDREAVLAPILRRVWAALLSLLLVAVAVRRGRP